MWLLVIGVLFIVAVALVIGSVVSLYRRGRTLARELGALHQDMDQTLGSARPGAAANPRGGHGDELPG